MNWNKLSYKILQLFLIKWSYRNLTYHLENSESREVACSLWLGPLHRFLCCGLYPIFLGTLFYWLVQFISVGARYTASFWDTSHGTEQNMQITVVTLSTYQRWHLIVPINHQTSFTKSIGFPLITNYSILAWLYCNKSAGWLLAFSHTEGEQKRDTQPTEGALKQILFENKWRLCLV